jgi:outer membrane protein assembly factor BamB
VAGLALLVLVAVAWFATSHGGRAAGAGKAPRQTAAAPARTPAAPVSLPAAESGLLPWQLPGPLSREVVVPGSSSRLMVLGGLMPGGASSDAVYALRTSTGAARRVGTLSAPVHDGAAAVAGRRALIFGGGSPVTVPAVQAMALPGPGAGGLVTGTDAGSLPAPRSDDAAVTIGGTTYVVGGYDGTRPDASVLATRDGRTFTVVASLRVPVRYPAVAALDGHIFVFGGQAITGPQAGAPVRVIQEVDPARHAATVIGELPEPLAGAAAVTVDGEVFVAGGESTAPQHRVPGLGTTQLTAGSSGGGTGAAAASPATATVSTIWAYDPATRRLLAAGRLQVPVSHAAAVVVGATAWLVGGESNGALVATVQMLRPSLAFGTAGVAGAGSPYFGDRLLIADRGNDRLLLLNAQMQVVWKYPSASAPRDRLGFYFPDDAFFVDHGTAIISNQEQNETIVIIAYPSGRIIWSYGHPGRTGTARGYLSEPDDAYLLKNGQITVADAQNCRVLVINHNHTVAHQVGTDGRCAHHPPVSMGSPNGDTPLADGNLLVSEINGSWVSEYTPAGKLSWAVQLPISYPSDPQQLGPDRYLIADYASPGQILEFNRAGRILYRYRDPSGPGELNHPSLAELLPSGVFMLNDDYNHRMVAIDPATGALVWQYGITGTPGTTRGQLNTPDGFDLLLPDGTTPTHAVTG